MSTTVSTASTERLTRTKSGVLHELLDMRFARHGFCRAAVDNIDGGSMALSILQHDLDDDRCQGIGLALIVHLD